MEISHLLSSFWPLTLITLKLLCPVLKFPLCCIVFFCISQHHQSRNPPTYSSGCTSTTTLSQLGWQKSLTWAALNAREQHHSQHAGHAISILAVVEKENPKYHGELKGWDKLNQDYYIRTRRKEQRSWNRGWALEDATTSSPPLVWAPATTWHHHQTSQPWASFLLIIWVLLLLAWFLSCVIHALPYTCQILVCNLFQSLCARLELIAPSAKGPSFSGSGPRFLTALPSTPEETIKDQEVPRSCTVLLPPQADLQPVLRAPLSPAGQSLGFHPL